MKNFIKIVVILLALVIYTKLIWQSGFDQGAAVSACVIESMLASEGEVVSLADSDACNDAKAYESNPLWNFRRSTDLNSTVVSNME